MCCWSLCCAEGGGALGLLCSPLQSHYMLPVHLQHQAPLHACVTLYARMCTQRRPLCCLLHRSGSSAVLVDWEAAELCLDLLLLVLLRNRDRLALVWPPVFEHLTAIMRGKGVDGALVAAAAVGLLRLCQRLLPCKPEAAEPLLRGLQLVPGLDPEVAWLNATVIAAEMLALVQVRDARTCQCEISFAFACAFLYEVACIYVQCACVCMHVHAAAQCCDCHHCCCCYCSAMQITPPQCTHPAPTYWLWASSLPSFPATLQILPVVGCIATHTCTVGLGQCVQLSEDDKCAARGIPGENAPAEILRSFRILFLCQKNQTPLSGSAHA